MKIEAQIKLATVYWLAGSYEDSRKAVEAILSRDPANIEGLLLHAGLLAQEGALSDAASAFEKVTELDADRRRVSLSFKQALPEWEERSSWSEKKPSGPRRREFEREDEVSDAPSFSADSSLEAILAELKERGIGRS